MGRDDVLSRNEIEARIAEGQTLIIADNLVIRCDSWLQYHPGGDIAIQHMVGKDATDEVNALHSPQALARMKKFAVGRIEGQWDNFIPPIQYGIFRTREEQQQQREQCAATFEMTVSEDEGSSDSASSTGSLHESFSDIAFDPKLRLRKPVLSSVTSLTSLDSTEQSMETYNEYRQTQKELDADRQIYPPVDPCTQRKIVEKYRQLEKRIRDAGLYKCNYWAYGRECVRYATFLTLALVLLHKGWYKTSAFFLGCFWHQLTFTAHDAGHMGITHNFTIDTCIGTFIANFCGGLSLGWWKRNHNVHHIVTNAPEHDPDIEHMPFFAISHRFLNNLYSTYYKKTLDYDAFAKFFLPIQNYLYYPVLCFGRFNLYRLSLEYLIKGLGPRKGEAAWYRWLELTGMFTFAYWFFYLIVYKTLPTNWDRFVYIMISHVVTMPLHVQITLSHFAMSTSDLGPTESFAQKMLRTTMDVDCPEWLDFFHGGLQFQVPSRILQQFICRVPSRCVFPKCETSDGILDLSATANLRSLEQVDSKTTADTGEIESK